jgi:hypothetical protein
MNKSETILLFQKLILELEQVKKIGVEHRYKNRGE